MPELISLDEALEGILDSVVATLKAATAKGKALEGVKAIIRGDRARPAPQTPAVWVRGLLGIPDHSQRTMAETWTLDLLIVSVIKETDPDEGYRQATALAAKARSEILKDRTLGARKYVQDVRSGRFEMSGPNMQNESLFGATAIVQVIFIILENNS